MAAEQVPIFKRPKAENSTLTFFWDGLTTDIVSSFTVNVVGSDDNVTAVVDPTKYQVKISNLDNGFTYSGSIFQTNTSQISSIASFYRPVMPGNKPGVPQAATATAVGSNQVLINWTQPLTNGGADIKWYMIKDLNTPIRFGARGYQRSLLTPMLSTGTHNLYVQAINDPGYSIPRFISTFSVPLNTLPVEPALWLDSSSVTNFVLSGSAITQWTDKSGFARHATMTGAACPTYSDTRGVVFDGSLDYFNINLNFLAGTSHIAFLVVRNYTFSGNFYGAAEGGFSSNSLHVGFSNTNTYRVNYWGNDFGPQVTSNYRQGQYNVLVYQWRPNIGKAVYANGGLEGSNIDAGVIGTMQGGGRIMNVVGQGFLQADIKEIVMITGAAVTDANRIAIQNFLFTKWAITPVA